MSSIFDGLRHSNKKKKKRTTAKKLPELSEHIILSEIPKVGYFTGSRVLGGSTEDSDFDYVMTEAEFKDLRNNTGLPLATSEKYTTSYQDGECSYKYEDSKGTITNIIIVPTTVKKRWIVATQRYLRLVNKEEPITKDLRVLIFSHLCNN